MANPIQTKTGAQTAGQTLTIQPDGTPTVGNWIVVAVFGFSGGGLTTPTASDTGGNSYSNAVAIQTSNTRFVTVLYAKVSSNAGSPFTVTFDVNDSGGVDDIFEMVVWEISSLDNSQTDGAATSAVQDSGSSISPGSQTPSVTGDFAAAVFVVGAALTTTWTSPSGFTSSLKNTVPATNAVGEAMFFNASPSAVNPTWSSISPAARPEATCLVLFKAVSGGTNFNITFIECPSSLAIPINLKPIIQGALS